MEKRGQVTIFIMLAILIVAGIILIFYLSGRTSTNTNEVINPRPFIETCTKEVVQDSILDLEQKSGIKNPSRTIQYKGENYTYLCYHADYERSCINLYPFLEKTFEEEIRKDTLDKIRSCFLNLVSEYESQGYEISQGELNYSIDILPNQVEVIIKKEISFSKDQFNTKISDFTFNFPSPLYNLISIAKKAVDDETEFCDFDSTYHTLLNPEVEIRKNYHDESRLYQVKDIKTSREIKFAIRSCVVPPGVLVI